ncbi:MAG: sensor histidine kinase [Ignavibacteriales bacterium]
MNNHELSLQTLDAILNRTIEAIHSSRDQMFNIAEMARSEFNRIQEELDATTAEAQKQIRVVDDLEKQDRAARYALMVVSRDFAHHTEDEIREAYEKASRIQIDLEVARDKENQLRQRRDELQRRIKHLKDMVSKAEGLLSRVGVVMDYLAGDLKKITAQVQDWQKRQELAVSVIRAQEEERRRVAREIHDGPAQALASMAMRLELCEKVFDSEPERAKSEIADLKRMARSSLQDVRKIIFDLRPMALDDLGLVPALRTYVAAFEDRTGVRVELKVLGEERRLSPPLEIAIYRLIQESLANVAKHANTSEAWVNVEATDKCVRVVVRDKGEGFDPGSVLQTTGERFGLMGMKERVTMFGGEINVKSRPGEGTKITVAIPLDPSAEKA